MAKYVRNFDATYFVSGIQVVVAEDMPVGSLVAVNAQGQAVKAKATGSLRAVGVVYKGTPKLWGEGHEFNREDIIKAGDLVDLYKFAIIKECDELPNDVKIGDVVYLGENGQVSATAPAAGKLKQVVGQVEVPAEKSVRLFLIDAGVIA